MKESARTLIRSICAGAAIALGGTVFLACQDKTVGALLFSIGLITVLIFGFDLFTGKACNEAFIRKPGTLAIIWLGNFIGAVVFGLMISTHPTLFDSASLVAVNKLAKPFYIVIIDGIICEFCIAVAVRGYAGIEGAARFIVVIAGVMVFILCGAEHVVADMFYLAAARITDLLNAVFFLAMATLGNVLGGIIWWMAEKSCQKG